MELLIIFYYLFLLFIAAIVLYFIIETAVRKGIDRSRIGQYFEKKYRDIEGEKSNTDKYK